MKLDRKNVKSLVLPKVEGVLALSEERGETLTEQEMFAIKLCYYITTQSAYYKASRSSWLVRRSLSLVNYMPLSQAKLTIAYQLLCDSQSGRITLNDLRAAKSQCAEARENLPKNIYAVGNGYTQELAPGCLEELIEQELDGFTRPIEEGI